jgi:hypothetical protein
MIRYAKVTVGLIGTWFVFSLGASALHLFHSAAGQPPLALGIGALAPIAVFLVWFAASPRFREFALTLNPRMLTLIHTWRVGGFVFLTLATFGILPWFFALPAGLGDMTVGFTAWFAATRLANPSRRSRFIFWQLFGITDLVVAVTLAALAGVIAPHGTSAEAMTVLPMSLIPTFAVPILFILHIICIVQARRWTRQGGAPAGQPLWQVSA